MQTVAHFQRTPCKTYVFHFTFKFAVTQHFIFFFIHLHQRILFYPVDILMSPFFGIFLITGYTVSLTHRSEPFVTVQLPTEFVIFHRPILPVDVFSIIIRRLITFVYKESMLQRVVCPFLFFFTDSDFVQIDIRSFYVCTCAIVIKQSFGCIRIFTFLMKCFHFFQSRIVQIEK